MHGRWRALRGAGHAPHLRPAALTVTASTQTPVSRTTSRLQDQRGRQLPWAGTEGSGVGGYFHLAPGEAYVGAGMSHRSPRDWPPSGQPWWRTQVAVRAMLSESAFARTFGEVGGRRLKRMPAGFPPTTPRRILLKLKDVTFGQALADDDVERAPFSPVESWPTLAAATPVLRFLATLPA